MSDKKKVLTVFYSWQTDLPNNTNRGFIMKALDDAGKQLQIETKGNISVTVGKSERPANDASGSLKLIVDQATAGVPGAPHIAQTILEKIAAADVFVADISTVNPGVRKFRKAPNPNVLFELGYAVAQLGWERIILVQNGAFTKDADIPFDIRGHRFTSYVRPEGKSDEERKKERIALASKLRKAILEIAEADSPRPFELQGMSEEMIRRARDRETLTGLFSRINLPILDEHIARVPDYLIWEVGALWDEFAGFYNRSAFHLYDESLNKLVRKFVESWRASMPGDENDYYRPMPNPFMQRFISQYEASRLRALDESRNAYERLRKGRNEFASALKSLLDYVRLSYPEIDIEVLGRAIGKSIRAEMSRIRTEE